MNIAAWGLTDLWQATVVSMPIPTMIAQIVGTGYFITNSVDPTGTAALTILGSSSDGRPSFPITGFTYEPTFGRKFPYGYDVEPDVP